MKKEIKFNHQADSVMESMGFAADREELNEKLDGIIQSFLREGKLNGSYLAEKIHNELAYEETLFLAYVSMSEIIENSMAMAFATMKENGELPN